MTTVPTALWLAVALLTSGGSPSSAPAPTQEEYGYVASVYVRDDNYVYIQVWSQASGRAFKPSQASTCGTGSAGRSKHPITDERSKAFMRLAVASFVTRSKVIV